MTDVSRNIAAIYERKRAAVYALSVYYAGLVLAEFRKRQLGGTGYYWSNKTFSAGNTVFSDAFQEGDTIGFFLAHAVEYGVYLEMANDRVHAALRPLIEEFFPKFKADLEKIYVD